MREGGRFVTLEGGEGAGKSTQARALAAALEARGERVVVTREPGGSEGAEAIRGLLLSGETTRWSARADHVERVIAPALANGAWVICDRYLDSTRAYQGGAEGIDDTAILSLHAFGASGLMPNRTFVLQVPVAEGERRASLRDAGVADRFARRGPTFHERVAAAFRAIAAAEPDRVRLIDAARAPEAITADLLGDLLADLPS